MSSDPFLTEIRMIADELDSPEAQSARLAEFAAEQITLTKLENERAIGSAQPAPRITVDGKQGTPLSSVQPDGRVVADFDLMGEVIEAIGTMLLHDAPVLSGAFRNSIRVFVDDVEHFPGEALPSGKRYVFLSPLPYSRKIEGSGVRDPQSDQAPDGVFEVVATLARKQFDNVADIRFGWEAVDRAPAKSTRAQRKAANDSRTPAIIIRPR